LGGQGALIDQVVRGDADPLEIDGVLRSREVRLHEVGDGAIEARGCEGPERGDVAARRVVALAEPHELEEEIAVEIFSVRVSEPREPLADQGFRKGEMLLDGAVWIEGSGSVHAGL